MLRRPRAHENEKSVDVTVMLASGTMAGMWTMECLVQFFVGALSAVQNTVRVTLYVGNTHKTLLKALIVALNPCTKSLH